MAAPRLGGDFFVHIWNSLTIPLFLPSPQCCWALSSAESPERALKAHSRKVVACGRRPLKGYDWSAGGCDAWGQCEGAGLEKEGQETARIAPISGLVGLWGIRAVFKK